MEIDMLLSGAETIIGQEELLEKISSGKKLKVKFGVDPTRPDLTFGHLVVFNKLKQFQNAGHEAILLIGDYTARIGDPSGRSELRPELTADQVEENAATYLEQAFKVLDPQKTTIRRNSEWFSGMSFADALNLTRKMTVAQMLERDDFSKRFKANQPISMVEFMYPLIQGYDSVILESDIEIGGSDQLFNMLVGRSLQKDLGMDIQAVLTMPLLVGLDGVRKMSKSYDNYISFNDSAKNIFGKTMSLSDDSMWEYFKLLLNYQETKINEMKEIHPMDAKKTLAESLTSLFYEEKVAKKEREEFSKVFSKGKVPEVMPTYSLSVLNLEKNNLLNVLSSTEHFDSKGEIRRLINQGAVKIDNDRIDDGEIVFQICSQTNEAIVKVGKKIFIKIIP
ncbi:MAG: tyrosine--tRNA ligase [Opitutae bacterium]|nr:tyrosine--tRNA ligase [Opitutae bacterium]MEC8421379.1 tyrosine--tRNA ligase [Verrucomicrobiota bacterium]|tara:strand:+ start:226 stop:1404 length:1179 start_codon:yes stop_codon:yes gene_type:complete